MKRTKMMAVLFALSVLILILLTNREQRLVCFSDNGNGQLVLTMDYAFSKEKIEPWYDAETDIWYFFMPGFAKKKVIYSDLEENLLFVDQMRVTDKFLWEANRTYNVEYQGQEYNVQFKESSAISTIFINTESGNMDYVDSKKGPEESGKLLSVSASGEVEYAGDMEKISGHGNSTWYYFAKKPYNIKLSSKGQIAGIGDAKDWVLLAMGFEGDKIHSKVAYDMAAALGGKYPVQSTWVNLYLNGKYNGLYLLTEDFEKKSDFNSDDSFLMKKEIAERAEDNPYTYVTGDGNTLTAEQPKEMTDLQFARICSAVQGAEDSLADPSGELSMIDVDSFAVQYLVDEISLNYDAFRTSSYIHKTARDSKIYAGPAWDYDASFAEYLHWGRRWVDPKSTVQGLDDERFTWYSRLQERPEFRERQREIFTEAQGYFDTLVNETIDLYAEQIAASVKNDDLLWKGSRGRIYRAGTYLTWESNVRYLKWFLANRINYLCEDMGVEREALVYEAQEVHEVTFVVDGAVIAQVTVEDGRTIDFAQIPELAAYDNTLWHFEYSGECYNTALPILENCRLVY